MVRQELQAQQQSLLKQDINFLHVQKNAKQLYTQLSQTANPAIQRSVKLLEANSSLRLMAAVEQIVQQSIDQATQSSQSLASKQVPDDSLSGSKESDESQVGKSPQTPQTPTQSAVRCLPASVANSASQTGSQQTSQRYTVPYSQSNYSIPGRRAASPSGLTSATASMPSQRLLLTRLTVLDVAQQLGLPDAELDRDAIAYIGNWARELSIATGKGELVQDAKDGSWGRVTFTDSGRNRPFENSCFKLWNRSFQKVQPEWTEETMNEHRLRYSSAFKGVIELG